MTYKNLENPVTFEQAKDSGISMQAPDGSKVFVQNQDIENAFKEGYSFPNENIDLYVNDMMGNTKQIKAKEFGNELLRGATFKPFAQEQVDQQKILAGQEVELNPAEKLGVFASSMGKGVSFGLTDVVAGAVNDLIDQISKNPESSNDILREARKKGEGYDLAGEIVGGVLGGAVSSGALGLVAKSSLPNIMKAAAGMGIGAAEGALYEVGTKAGEAVLGDPTVNAEKIIMSAGTGALFGLGGGLLGESLSALGTKFGTLAPKKYTKELPDINVRPVGDASQSPLTKSPIFEVTNPQGDLVGSVRLSVANENSIHIAGRHTANIEDFDLPDSAFEDGTADALLNDLIGKFGQVNSSSEGNSLGKLQELLEVRGSKHVDEQGNTFYSIVNPVEKEIKSTDELIQEYGEMVDKQLDLAPAEKRMWARFTNKGNKEFRDKVIEYYNDPTKLQVELPRFFEGIDKALIDFTKTAEAAKTKLASNLDSTAVPVITDGITSAQDNILQQLEIAIDSPVLKHTGYLQTLESAFEALEKVKVSNNAEQMWLQSREIVRGLDNSYNLIKKQVLPYERNKIKAGSLRKILDTTVLKNKDLPNSVGERFSEIQESHAKFMAAANKFARSFREGKKLDRPINISALKSTIKTHSPMDLTKRMVASDGYLYQMKQFADELKKHPDLVDNPEILDTVSKISTERISDLRDIIEADMLVKNIESSGELGKMKNDMLKNALSVGGAFAASRVTDLIAPGLSPFSWYFGAKLGQSSADKVLKSKTPITVINRINTTQGWKSKANEKVISMVDYVADIAKKYPEGLKPKALAPKVATIVGTNFRDSDSRNEKAAKIVHRIDTISESALETIAQELEDIPQHATAIKQKLSDNIAYVRKNIPRPSEDIEMSRKDFNKMLSIVEAAFDPESALARAISEKDPEMLKHVKALIGNTYSELVAKVNMKANVKKLPRDKRALLNMLNTVESQGVSEVTPPAPEVGVNVPAAQPGPGRPSKPDLDLGTQTEMLPGDAIQE